MKKSLRSNLEAAGHYGVYKYGIQETALKQILFLNS